MATEDKKKSLLSVVGPVLMATGCVAVAAAGAAMSASDTTGTDEAAPRTASSDSSIEGRLRG